MTEDYYKILEVRRDASQEEIRRAYRRLALRLHPDKNPQGKEAAEAHFKAVSEAYEILSDKAKRRLYDQFGKSAFDAQPQTQSPSTNLNGATYAFTFRDPREVFRDFFGTAGGPFQDLFGRQDQGVAKEARGTTILTGGLPFWQQSFSGGRRPGFLYNMDDVFFATHVPAGMSVAPGFTGVPTQEMLSAWYEGGKRIETRTTLDDSVKMVLRFEDGVPVSRAVNGFVQAVTENNEVQGSVPTAPPAAGGAPVFSKRSSQTRLPRPPSRTFVETSSVRQSDSKQGIPPKSAAIHAPSKTGRSRTRSGKPPGGPKDAPKCFKPSKKDSADVVAGPSASQTQPKRKQSK